MPEMQANFDGFKQVKKCTNSSHLLATLAGNRF